jgi:TFIIF-interacting CTD phosphatase-like protein
MTDETLDTSSEEHEPPPLISVGLSEEIHKAAYFLTQNPQLKTNPAEVPILGPKNDAKQFLLVLDLDLTLVFAERVDNTDLERLPDREPDVKLTIREGDDFGIIPREFTDQEVGVWYRPGLLQFLAHASEFSEIIIFSAGKPAYVEAVVKAIDPRSEVIGRFFSAANVTYYENSLVECDGQDFGLKDISGFLYGEHPRSRSKVIIVDDMPSYHAKYLSNVIPIEPYLGEADDQELPQLLEFLQRLVREEDALAAIKRKFGLSELLERYVQAGGLQYTSLDHLEVATNCRSIDADIHSLMNNMVI